jgi:hypothetical protein
MSADQIAVENFPAAQTRSVIGRGIDPLWLDRRTIVYRDGVTWYRVNVNDDASLAGPPREWFSDPRFIDTNLRSHALTPSGEIIYLRSVAPTSSTHLRVIPRWTTAVEEAVAGAVRR